MRSASGVSTIALRVIPPLGGGTDPSSLAHTNTRAHAPGMSLTRQERDDDGVVYLSKNMEYYIRRVGGPRYNKAGEREREKERTRVREMQSSQS